MTNTIIDLFSGAGGLTTGFYLAGFKPLCAIDINHKALNTYKHNYPSTKVIHQDICKINPYEVRVCLGLQREELTVLVGGPPCQGFSRNIPAGYRYLDEPRNQLYKNFLEFVREFRPLYVLMENVPEILKAYDGVVAEQITQQLESIGYKVTSASLNSAYYGVPQTRSRACFLASLDYSPVFPKATHFGDIRSDIRPGKARNLSRQLSLFDVKSTQILTVQDAIGDLPPLDAGQEYTDESYPSPPQTSYQMLLRSKSDQLVNHIARPLSPIQMARVRVLKEGQDARDLPSELAPKKHYSGAYGRLSWNRPARTITKSLFHPGSGRFFHPIQNRTITIREAARLQSFPDSFHFTGTFTEMAAQIGESVPPLLSQAIADTILHPHLYQDHSH